LSVPDKEWISMHLSRYKLNQTTLKLKI
jgi:hypothetical protein